MLSASSPDDEALVLGAKYFGFEFINRIDSSAIINTWDVTSPPPSAAQKHSRSPLNSGVVASSPLAAAAAAPAAAAASSGSDGVTGGENTCFSSEIVIASPHPTSVVAVSPTGGGGPAATATDTTALVEGVDETTVNRANAAPPLASAAPPAPSANSTNHRESAQAEGEGRSEQGPQEGGGGIQATTTGSPGGSAANVTPASYEVCVWAGGWVDGLGEISSVCASCACCSFVVQPTIAGDHSQ